MTNVFIINGGHKFAHSPGRFNRTLLEKTKSFLETKEVFIFKQLKLVKITISIQKLRSIDGLISLFIIHLSGGFKYPLDSKSI